VYHNSPQRTQNNFCSNELTAVLLQRCCDSIPCAVAAGGPSSLHSPGSGALHQPGQLVPGSPNVRRHLRHNARAEPVPGRQRSGGCRVGLISLRRSEFYTIVCIEPDLSSTMAMTSIALAGRLTTHCDLQEVAMPKRSLWCPMRPPGPSWANLGVPRD
jgi:hypothetical protein